MRKFDFETIRVSACDGLTTMLLKRIMCSQSKAEIGEQAVINNPTFRGIVILVESVEQDPDTKLQGQSNPLNRKEFLTRRQRKKQIKIRANGRIRGTIPMFLFFVWLLRYLTSYADSSECAVTGRSETSTTMNAVQQEAFENTVRKRSGFRNNK